MRLSTAPRFLALVVRGIYMGDPEDDTWGFQYCRNLLPEAWEKLASHSPQEDHGDLFAACVRDIDDPDEARALESRQGFRRLFGIVVRQHHKTRRHSQTRYDGMMKSWSCARLSIAYFANDIFLPPMYLPENVHKLAGLPGAIVQGRRDLICPTRNAWMLHKAWPDATPHHQR